MIKSSSYSHRIALLIMVHQKNEHIKNWVPKIYTTNNKYKIILFQEVRIKNLHNKEII